MCITFTIWRVYLHIHLVWTHLFIARLTYVLPEESRWEIARFFHTFLHVSHWVLGSISYQDVIYYWVRGDGCDLLKSSHCCFFFYFWLWKFFKCGALSLLIEFGVVILRFWCWNYKLECSLGITCFLLISNFTLKLSWLNLRFNLLLINNNFCTVDSLRSRYLIPIVHYFLN